MHIQRFIDINSCTQANINIYSRSHPTHYHHTHTRTQTHIHTYTWIEARSQPASLHQHIRFVFNPQHASHNDRNFFLLNSEEANPNRVHERIYDLTPGKFPYCTQNSITVNKLNLFLPFFFFSSEQMRSGRSNIRREGGVIRRRLLY